MFDIYDFSDIRPYQDEEVNEVLLNLVQKDFFLPIVKNLYPGQDPGIIKKSICEVSTIYDFQTKIIYPILKKLLKKTSNGISAKGFKNLSREKSFLFISNHHDIVLDPSILNIILFEKGFKTTKVAIGDNLLNKDWIKDLARLNKSFIVHRSPPMKQALLYSQQLSNFIKHSLLKEKESIWIAQREGRSKDGNDITQVSLLKMLAYGGGDDKFEYLQSLNFLPVAISYEYDPCDLLKVKEILIKEKNQEYVKNSEEDIFSMVTGITGFKGRIHVSCGKLIDHEFDEIIQHETAKEQYSSLAATIDEQIQSIIKLWPTNYIAYDMLTGKDTYHKEYSDDQKKSFVGYVEKKLTDAGLDLEDSKVRFLSIYANPVKNKIRLTEF